MVRLVSRTKGEDMSDLEEPTQPPTEPHGADESLAPPTVEQSVVDEAVVAEEPGTPWPGSAKATAAVLALIAVIAVIAAIVGFAQNASSNDEVDEITVERDAAVAEAQAAQSERDALADELADSEVTAAELRDQRDQAVVDGEVLAGELAVETARADAAEEAIENILGLLPLEIDADLTGFDLVGGYSISFAEAFCEGLPGCGTLPGVNTASIRANAGNLQMVVDNVLTVDLFAVDGALFGITDSDTVVAPCGDVTRVARVSVTLFADGVTVPGDGPRQLTGLGASLVVDAPAVEGCASGLVFYGSSLTPVG